MDELLSRFPDIAEDVFESLNHESLVQCKEASRSISSFMEEGTKFWKRIIRKYLQNTYSSVPNRRAGPNKRAGGKILPKTLNVQVRIDVQGELFLENQ